MNSKIENKANQLRRLLLNKVTAKVNRSTDSELTKEKYAYVSIISSTSSIKDQTKAIRLLSLITLLAD